MELECDYSETIRRIYGKNSKFSIPIKEDHLLKAAIVVERLFPPSSRRNTFRILASLNLLNAAIKQKAFRNMVTYGYIKGMAARLLLHLAINPIKGVDTYWSLSEKVAYFRVYGVQISFHYIPYIPQLRPYLQIVCSVPEQFSGIYLQRIAVEVFKLACPMEVEWDADEEEHARYKMLHHLEKGSTPPKSLNHADDDTPEPPAPKTKTVPPKPTLPELPKHPDGRLMHPHYVEDKNMSLYTALTFNVWDAQQFVLWRKDTRALTPIARYNGKNRDELTEWLRSVEPRMKARKKKMVRDHFYYVSPQKKISALQRSRYLIKLSQNGYLFEQGFCLNLFLSYGIVRYLAVLYPTLKFLCRVDYNRWLEKRHFYTRETIYSVPLDSPARRYKVWMVVDTDHLLDNFDPEVLPQRLIDDYMEARDMKSDFKVTYGDDGLKGIRAYGHLQLLPNCYYKISLHGFFAHIQEKEGGLWAIYSLGCEDFDTDFIYERIWYDDSQGAILGLVDGEVEEIFSYHFVK